MKNICVIGSIGKLGSELMKHPNTVACPWMFENDTSVIDNWFRDHPQIDTVWHVARTCRKVGTRRDHETFLLEHNGMLNLLNTKARNCRIVYASSKIVYGIYGFNCCLGNCEHDYNIMNVEEVAKHFHDNKIGTYNCPEWQDTRQLNIRELDNQRTIYANTKLANESLIRKYCPNFKIVRIWDIV